MLGRVHRYMTDHDCKCTQTDTPGWWGVGFCSTHSGDSLLPPGTTNMVTGRMLAYNKIWVAECWLGEVLLDSNSRGHQCFFFYLIFLTPTWFPSNMYLEYEADLKCWCLSQCEFCNLWFIFSAVIQNNDQVIDKQEDIYVLLIFHYVLLIFHALTFHKPCCTIFVTGDISKAFDYPTAGP